MTYNEFSGTSNPAEFNSTAVALIQSDYDANLSVGRNFTRSPDLEKLRVWANAF